MIARILGWILILSGIVVLVADGVVSIQVGRWTPTAISELWSRLDRPSFEVGRDIMGDATLGFWSVPALIAMGMLLLLLFPRDRG